MVFIPKPDPDDPLKVRRIMAFAVVFQAVFFFIPLLAYMVVFYGLHDSIALALIGLQGAIVGGPCGAYLWAANKKDKA